MNIKIRLLRRPVTTITWLAVLTAMSLLVSLGAGVLYSADNLPERLDEHHTTIAVQSRTVEEVAPYTWTYGDVYLMQEQLQTLTQMEQVELVDLRTLTGAYIPELMALTGEKDWYGSEPLEPYNFANESYTGVIVCGTAEMVWEQSYGSVVNWDMSLVGLGENIGERYMCAMLQVEEIVSGHPNMYIFENEKYSKYTGKVVVRFPVFDDGGENFFREGERYLVCGTYYPNVQYHGDEPFDHTVADGCALINGLNRYGVSTSPCSSFIRNGNSIYGYRETVCEQIPLTEEDILAGSKDIMRLTAADKEFPTAALLETSVTEFLADPDNAQWAAVVSENDAALHSLPVLGTQCMESMYAFVKNEASLVEGRMFTQEEYDSGAKVCVISQTLANENGIQVGDTLTLNQFVMTEDMISSNNSLYDHRDPGLTNLSLGMDPVPEQYSTENEEFTVVGLYRQEAEWVEGSFAFTPNTVFIPQQAQVKGGFGGESVLVEKTEVDSEGNTDRYTAIDTRGTYGILFSLKLKNGQMEAFLEALQNTDLAERQILVFDQGYDAAIESVAAVGGSAKKLFVIAAAGWGLLLALYLLLYQGMQRRNLGTMRSLGATPKRTKRYLFGSGLVLAAAGITVGSALSGVVMKLVQDKLFGFTLSQTTMQGHSGGMELDHAALTAMLSESQLPLESLLILAVLQFVVIALALWLQAALLARRSPRKLLGV